MERRPHHRLVCPQRFWFRRLPPLYLDRWYGAACQLRRLCAAPEAVYNGNYETYWRINCEHNAPQYKFYHMTQGSSGGVQGITTTATHLPCGAAIKLTPFMNYCAVCGGSIRLVDNVPVAAEPQNADYMRFDP